MKKYTEKIFEMIRDGGWKGFDYNESEGMHHGGFGFPEGSIVKNVDIFIEEKTDFGVFVVVRPDYEIPEGTDVTELYKLLNRLNLTTVLRGRFVLTDNNVLLFVMFVDMPDDPANIDIYHMRKTVINMPIETLLAYISEIDLVASGKADAKTAFQRIIEAAADEAAAEEEKDDSSSHDKSKMA